MSNKLINYIIELLAGVVRAFRPFQALLRAFVSKVDVRIFENMTAFSLQGTVFKEIYQIPIFVNREQLWDSILDQTGKSTKITYIEYGVHEGYSINYFASRNLNPESIFIGLDSFKGLPEDWFNAPKGTFDKKGMIPKTNDNRIRFVPGWFQDTSDDLYRLLEDKNLGALLVHYDPDLYSSTLFGLAKIDNLKMSYVAIFDDFGGHGERALYNYCQAFNATVSFIARTVWPDKNIPNQVMCRILPHQAGRLNRPPERADATSG